MMMFQSTCAAVHAHLPEVFSQDEFDFLTNFSAANGKDENGEMRTFCFIIPLNILL